MSPVTKLRAVSPSPRLSYTAPVTASPGGPSLSTAAGSSVTVQTLRGRDQTPTLSYRGTPRASNSRSLSCDIIRTAAQFRDRTTISSDGSTRANTIRSVNSSDTLAPYSVDRTMSLPTLQASQKSLAQGTGITWTLAAPSQILAAPGSHVSSAPGEQTAPSSTEPAAVA